MRAALRKFLETLLSLWWRTYGWVRYAGWRKSKYHATLEAAPGVTTLTLVNDGHILGTVVLSQFTRSFYSGMSVEFVDLGQIMDAREVKRDVSFEDLMRVANEETKP